jgi:hypothetical protein
VLHANADERYRGPHAQLFKEETPAERGMEDTVLGAAIQGMERDDVRVQASGHAAPQRPSQARGGADWCASHDAASSSAGPTNPYVITLQTVLIRYFDRVLV